MAATRVADGPITFEAVIVPHRSLGRRGLRWLSGVLFALNAGVAAGLWLVGAWPAIGFIGGEIVLAIWLLHRHAMGARSSEMLLLSDAGLRVVQVSERGLRSERELPCGWLRASLDERPGRTPALLVRSRGEAVEIGAALGEMEKRQLALALQDALARQRHPVFDNPQLRDREPQPL